MRRFTGAGYHLSEFHCFDLNPFDHLGINKKTLDTVHLFAGLLWLDDVENVDAVVKLPMI